MPSKYLKSEKSSGDEVVKVTDQVEIEPTTSHFAIVLLNTLPIQCHYSSS